MFLIQVGMWYSKPYPSCKELKQVMCGLYGEMEYGCARFIFFSLEIWSLCPLVSLLSWIISGCWKQKKDNLGLGHMAKPRESQKMLSGHTCVLVNKSLRPQEIPTKLPKRNFSNMYSMLLQHVLHFASGKCVNLFKKKKQKREKAKSKMRKVRRNCRKNANEN